MNVYIRTYCTSTQSVHMNVYIRTFCTSIYSRSIWMYTYVRTALAYTVGPYECIHTYVHTSTQSVHMNVYIRTYCTSTQSVHMNVYIRTYCTSTCSRSTWMYTLTVIILNDHNHFLLSYDAIRHGKVKGHQQLVVTLNETIVVSGDSETGLIRVAKLKGQTCWGVIITTRCGGK